MKLVKAFLTHVKDLKNELTFLMRVRYSWYLDPRSVWHGDHLPIFTFHGVQPDLFEKQLAYLSANGYQTLTLAEMMKFLSGTKKLSKRSVMLTFDDGINSIRTYGKPLLEKYGFKAVAFVVPGYTGLPGYLEWDEIRELHASGTFEIQSHTMTHPPMTLGEGRDIAKLKKELKESKEVIEKQIPGHTVNALCFPFGLGSDEAVELSKKVGYTSVFWSDHPKRVKNSAGDDPFYIVRVKHDFITRLPGKNRHSLLSLLALKVKRRLKNEAYA